MVDKAKSPQRRAAEHLHLLLTENANGDLVVPSPKAIQRELRDIASKAGGSAVIRAATNRVVSSSEVIRDRPPQYLHTLRNSVAKPLDELDKAVRSERRKKPTTLETLAKIVENITSRGDDGTLRAQVLMGAVSDAFDAYGIRSPRPVTPVDEALLKETMSRSSLIRGSKTRPVRDTGNILELDLTTPPTVHRVEAPQLETPPTGISPDGRFLQVEVPTGQVSDRPGLEQIGHIAYQVGLAVKQEDGDWQPVQLAPQVPFLDYDPSIHTYQQLAHPFTDGLKPGFYDYAVVVRAAPYNVTQKTEVMSSRKLRMGFQNADDEKLLLQTLEEMAGKRAAAMFTETFQDNGLQISADRAARILNYLTENERQDLLKAPITSALSWKENRQTFNLSFCARVGTLEDPGQTMPLGIHMQDPRTGVELMNSGDSPDEMDAEDRAIMQVMDPEGDPEHPLGVVFTYADTHITRGRSESTDRSIHTSVKRRKLQVVALTRRESLAQGPASTSSLVEVVPTIVYRERQEAVTEVAEHLPTLRSLLLYYAARPDGEYFPIEWNTPEIYAKHQQIQEEIEEERLRYSSPSRGFYGGGLDLFGPKGGGLRGGLGSYRSGYRSGATVLGEEQEGGEATINKVDVAAQLAPLTISFVFKNPS